MNPQSSEDIKKIELMNLRFFEIFLIAFIIVIIYILYMEFRILYDIYKYNISDIGLTISFVMILMVFCMLMLFLKLLIKYHHLTKNIDIIVKNKWKYIHEKFHLPEILKFGFWALILGGILETIFFIDDLFHDNYESKFDGLVPIICILIFLIFMRYFAWKNFLKYDLTIRRRFHNIELSTMNSIIEKSLIQNNYKFKRLGGKKIFGRNFFDEKFRINNKIEIELQSEKKLNISKNNKNIINTSIVIRSENSNDLKCIELIINSINEISEIHIRKHNEINNSFTKLV